VFGRLLVSWIKTLSVKRSNPSLLFVYAIADALYVLYI